MSSDVLPKLSGMAAGILCASRRAASVATVGASNRSLIERFTPNRARSREIIRVAVSESAPSAWISSSMSICFKPRRPAQVSESSRSNAERGSLLSRRPAGARSPSDAKCGCESCAPDLAVGGLRNLSHDPNQPRDLEPRTALEREIAELARADLALANDHRGGNILAKPAMGDGENSRFD